MKINAYTSVMIQNSVMWASTAAAVAYCVRTTGDTSSLWFLLVPLFGGYSVKNPDAGSKKE